MHVPHAVVPFALASFAILVTLLAWAAFAHSQAGFNGTSPPLPDIASIGSVAYTIPGKDFDDLVVRPADASVAPQVIATFANSGSTGYHIHGAASPLGDRIAVVSLDPFATRASGRLSLVEVNDRAVVAIEGNFDYFTRIAWSPDGARVAAVRYLDSPSGKTQSVVEVDVETGMIRPVAEFADALDVVPVGYSFDSSRLFVVVVDQKGSNLYMERAGKSQLVAELSPGRTRDWSLSPDGSRLAFVDILAGGSRTFVGRTLVVATGAVTTLPAEKDQVGSSWLPGSPIPAFGGPGGAWQLSQPDAQNAYLIPGAWSPDANYLVATVYADGSERDGRAATSLELVARETAEAQSTRTVLSELSGAAFLGWVHNLN
ncbi:MAG: hypothetical protein ABI577_07480 [bacterium]